MSSDSYRGYLLRADHIGSLLRSDTVLNLWYKDPRDLEAKKGELKQLEDAEIKEAIHLQQQLGFHAVTDGEIRRKLHWGSFFIDLDGFEEVPVTDTGVFRPYLNITKLFSETGVEGATTLLCTGKIQHVKSSFLADFQFLKSLVKPEQVKDIKITMCSLEINHLIYKQGRAYTKSAYETDDEYFADLAKAFRQEVRILYDEGLRRLQIDNPNLGYFCDVDVHQGWAKDPENIRTSSEQVDAYVKLINDSIRGFPKDLHISLHLCKGNFKSGHWASGGYDRISTQLFKGCDVDTFLLEFDTERSGGFEPLKDLPVHKAVVLGLITTKNGILEDFGRLQERVREAACCMADSSGQSIEEALQRIGVSPQCGFASANVGNRITKEQMIEKLKLVRNLADSMWPGEP